MKRISLIALFVSCGLASAAEIYDNVESTRPKLGIEVGATFNDVSGPSGINSSNRTGFAAGVRAEFPLTPYLAFQPEALFVQRGVKLGGGSYNITAKYNTIEVPLFLKASIGEAVSPYLVAGPVMFFNVSSSVEANTPGGSAAANFEPRTFEFGVALGGGIDIGPVFVAANYLIGLTDLESNNPQYQSRGVQLLGGVQF